MKLLKESIDKYGILNPLIVRPLKEGVYEIVSGHRRRFAAEKLGYRKVPVIIRMPEMARLLGGERKTVYSILRHPDYKDIFKIVIVADRKRITKESFEKFLESQDK